MTPPEITQRLKEVFLTGKWIANTNYKEQIENLHWQDAVKSIHHLNSIGVLVFHINYYLGGLINVFNGGKLEIKDKYSFDMPPISNEEDWQQLKNIFLQNAETFANLIYEMDAAQLHKAFVEEKYGSYWRNIEGVLEHSYYHLGQIVLLKKLLAANK